MEQQTRRVNPSIAKMRWRNDHLIHEVTGSVVTYKTRADELVTVLRSLLERLIPSNITVIDNSPDEQLRIAVEKTGACYIKMPRNVGFGAGHNRAIVRHAGSSRYHVIVNPDIQFKPETIDKL